MCSRRVGCERKGAYHMAWISPRRALVAGGISIALALGIASTQMCLSAWLRYGLLLDECPDGVPRQTVFVEAQGVTRGQKSSVRVRAVAHYTLGASDSALQSPLPRFEPSLSLVGPDGKEAPLEVAEWATAGADKVALLSFPQVGDGDWRLRAKVKSALGESTHDLPLPLYAPARVHVLTDRPLYEPGHVVKLRAVVLRAKDLAPLDGRPGRWIVTDPSGEVMLEEQAPAGEWGVVRGDFPLDGQAPTGDWRVRWVSGGASDEVSFRVAPFSLPRFRIEAEPAKPFYRRHERPVLRGAVVYSSGAPVANADLTLSWSVRGEWPPPPSWLSGGLPTRAKAGGNGRFTLELPPVPEDLQKQATLVALISATDAAGDRVDGSAAVLLSEDPIRVSAVTELSGGLVEGFNNRLYLRATTADGRVLSGATLLVKRAWDPKDKGVEATADEDGVASLQIDPGPPVNVVIPPLPFRPPPKQPAVTARQAIELIGGAEPPLADQVAMEKWLESLEGCARWTHDVSEEVTVGLRVDATGRVRFAAPPKTRLGRCVAQVLSERALPPGRERLYAVSYSFDASDLPRLHVQTEAVPEDEATSQIGQAVADAAMGLRDCIPPTAPSASLPRVARWQVRAHGKEVEVIWARVPGGDPFDAGALDCMESRFRTVALEQPSPIDAIGFARFSVEAPERYEAIRPRATTLLGYELVVTAKRSGEALGTTKLVLRPGAVPPVRLRASPILAEPGATVEVEILRGPDFHGELPKKLFLAHGHASIEAEVDPKTRTARFQLPPDAEGWMEASWSGARAVVFVKPRAQLSVSVTPDRERYAPGQLAHLSVETRLGQTGGPAAVGLFGVDESLSQLVPLPGADDFARVRPQVQSVPAFDALDAQALMQGRIRGANAAAATVLRVGALPPAVELENPVYASGGGELDPLVALTDSFYTVLQELHAQTRAWEQSAPENEKMTPPKMAKLWERALDECHKRGQPVTDAFGRRLKLSQLPSDLLALVDPRAVVVQGTRLPEDVESWTGWVAKEMP